jgi:hypothetical protein
MPIFSMEYTVKFRAGGPITVETSSPTKKTWWEKKLGEALTSAPPPIREEYFLDEFKEGKFIPAPLLAVRLARSGWDVEIGEDGHYLTAARDVRGGMKTLTLQEKTRGGDSRFWSWWLYDTKL